MTMVSGLLCPRPSLFLALFLLLFAESYAAKYAWTMSHKATRGVQGSSSLSPNQQRRIRKTRGELVRRRQNHRPPTRLRANMRSSSTVELQSLIGNNPSQLIPDEQEVEGGEGILTEGKFRWQKTGVDIHYLRARPQPSAKALDHEEETNYDKGKHEDKQGTPPILFLTGFGVGSFQFEESLKCMARKGRVAYSMDWLGQGKSWPEDIKGLQISADLWVEQAQAFIKDRIGQPVYVAGNSLGGFLGAQLAARYPDLVKGVVLYNAAPFWAFRPSEVFRPEKAEDGGSLWHLVWDGKLPAPQIYRTFASRAFDNLRHEFNVKTLIDLVYAQKEASELSDGSDLKRK
eukprot:jgi/Bigna1/85474/estExt_fgenesh1_pg.C_40169